MKIGWKVNRRLPGRGYHAPVFLLLTCVLLIVPSGPAFASVKVGTVKLTFTSEKRDEDGIPVVEAESDSSRYSVNGVLTLEEYEKEWETDDDDDTDKNKKDNSDLLAYNETYRAMQVYSELVYAVELAAAEDYYFVADADKIRLSGLGASIVRMERLNSKTTLTLFVRFQELDQLAAAVDRAFWTDHGYGSWTDAGAAWYELRFYAGGRLRGGKRITGGTRYDFRPLMQSEGSYHYMVRPVTASGGTGEWVESEILAVTREDAERNREKFALLTETDGDGSAPPVSVSYLNTGWQGDADGRLWYREQDGTYPQQNWLPEDGNWYFFDGDGYLVRESYVKWGTDTYYLDSEGRMMTDGKTPDGRLAQADGSLRWPEY